MSTKVLIATDKPFASSAVQGIREIVEKAGYELVLLEKYTSQDELIAAVADVDAMIIRSDKATKEVIDAAKNLKIIVRAGAGYDNIDLQACTDKGIVAMNTPGQNSNAVAELVFGMMVYSARNFYNGKSGTELKGKRIGVHAYGNVGQNVGRIAHGFGMEVYAYDPFMTAEQISAAGAIQVETVEQLYEMCDYISLHIPATPETKQSINYALLNRMPKGGVLVNTARKEVIHEADLLKFMADRVDFRYLSDIAPDNAAEFAAFEGRYFFTPKKMGAQTEEANVNAGLAAARQIVDFLTTGNRKFQVNK
ncbi:MAG: 3-phosphoglycerate dehydrogenase [Culturomica sp.]|jgi:D-3-phosphoglycerate dehydrogenase|nr:3-phosphoglycerate dehydrogenase [Culturomica sp.]